MDIELFLNRAKNTVAAVGCFFAAIFILYRGNMVENPGASSFVVPVMCAMTALALGATGLTMALRALPKSE